MAVSERHGQQTRDDNGCSTECEAQMNGRSSFESGPKRGEVEGFGCRQTIAGRGKHRGDKGVAEG
jgi:hypothetical protein